MHNSQFITLTVTYILYRFQKSPHVLISCMSPSSSIIVVTETSVDHFSIATGKVRDDVYNTSYVATQKK